MLRTWRRSRRLGASALIAGAVILLTAGFFPWPVSADKVQRALSLTFRSGGGTSLEIAGRASFTVLPLPHVTVEKVTLDYRSGTMRVSATEASIGLDALALLSRRVVPRNVLFDHLAAETPGGADTPIALFRNLVVAGSSERILPALDWIAVRDGRLQMATPSPQDGVIDQMSAMWTPGKAAGPFDLTLSGQWRGDQVALTISGPSGDLAGQSGEAAAKLQLTTRLLNLSFSGNLFGGGEPKADGRIEASTPDAVALTAWLGLPEPLPGRLDRVKLSGDMTAAGQQLALANAQLSLNNDQYDGVFGLRLDEGRPTLSATLATESADLTDQFQFLVPRQAPDGSWSQEHYDTGAFDIADIDLRLSARQLVLGNLKLEGAAMSLLLHARRFELSLAEAGIAGGSAKGRLVVTPAPQGVEMRGQGSIDNADIGGALAEGLGLKRLNGRGSVTLTAEATGDSTAALANTLDGRANVSLSDGELLGIDLDRFLVRLERRSLIAAALDVPTGRTPFDSAVLDLRVAAGRVEINECSFKSRTLNINLGGSTEAPDRVLNFSGILASNERSGRTTRVPFTVRGTWDAPRFSPQPDNGRKQL